MDERVNKIVSSAIEAVLPDKSVKEALGQIKLDGNIHIISIGKAA